jgi:hypothetical protein
MLVSSVQDEIFNIQTFNSRECVNSIHIKRRSMKENTIKRKVTSVPITRSDAWMGGSTKVPSSNGYEK